MNIVCSADDGYIFQTSVMLNSLYAALERDPALEHEIAQERDPALERDAVTVYFIEVRLSDESKNFITKNCEKENFKIVFVHLDPTLLEGMPEYNHLKKESYVRLFLHSILPESVDRVLWLDGDIVVRKSIRDFYEQDLEGKIFAMVPDEITDSRDLYRLYEVFRFPKDGAYCNAGVLLIDLQAYAKNYDEQALRDFINEYYDYITYEDQDIINNLYRGTIKVINDKKWNCHSNSTVTEQEISDACILHFAGTQKPWKRHVPGDTYYWKYARKLPGGTSKYLKVSVKNLCRAVLKTLGLKRN